MTQIRSSVFVIAEAGVNHNGDVALAKQLVDVADAAGVDAVKFQTWKPGELTGRFAFKVAYLDSTTESSESRYELSNRLALSYDAFRELKAYCDDREVLFLSTPDGFESLDFLVDELDMPIIKVGSTEVTHPQFLEAVGRKQRPVILSTGLSNLGEVEAALSALRRGGAADITVLQCTSEYPAPDAEMNLRAMQTIAAAFGVNVGLSDHSRGTIAPIAAAAMGAAVVEKHFTLDRAMDGPDHAASITGEELGELTDALRRVAVMMGDGIKTPTPSERANTTGIRRSVVARDPIPAGTVLESHMLVCKRPATGVAPADMEVLVGLRTCRDLDEDEPITWGHVGPCP
jgi:N,N'-diacetyllegionaminate synthase